MAAIFVVRVWLPDRPGALGAVASRIGAVRGDLVGIDILETGAGRAIDELVVSLPSDDLVPLLVKEMQEVEGVDVEDIRAVRGDLPDARVTALESAAELLSQPDAASVCSALVDHVVRDFETDWAAVLGSGGDPGVLAGSGEVPSPSWLAAFVAPRSMRRSSSPSVKSAMAAAVVSSSLSRSSPCRYDGSRHSDTAESSSTCTSPIASRSCTVW